MLAEVLHTNLRRSNQGTSIPFRPDIEGLRALAVGLVIASHAGLPFLRSGFVGVDVFFVLSGYLITSLLMQEISSSDTVNFARFYARRARRCQIGCAVPIDAISKVGGQIIYGDADRLTASFSRSLAAVLFQRLRDSEQ